MLLFLTSRSLSLCCLVEWDVTSARPGLAGPRVYWGQHGGTPPSLPPPFPALWDWVRVKACLPTEATRVRELEHLLHFQAGARRGDPCLALPTLPRPLRRCFLVLQGRKGKWEISFPFNPAETSVGDVCSFSVGIWLE